MKRCSVCNEELAPIFEGQEKHDTCKDCEDGIDGEK